MVTRYLYKNGNVDNMIYYVHKNSHKINFVLKLLSREKYYYQRVIIKNYIYYQKNFIKELSKEFH